jgi:hypothetical protein
MSIEATHRIFRDHAVQLLCRYGRQVFDSDSNERLSYELYQCEISITENYEVVDFKREDEPADDKWPFWK